jgi:hypothetical protein
MTIADRGANSLPSVGHAGKPTACGLFVSPGQFTPDRPAPDARMRCGGRQAAHHAGPFESEQQALGTPAVREIYAAFRARPGQGGMHPGSLAMLRAACEGADVELGAYDLRILSWLAGWEPQICAVIAGLVTRASIGGEAVRP